MNTIKFSYNWNRKLGNIAFTTFRMHNEGKYKVGERYKIECKGVVPFNAIILDIRKLKLEQINEFIARIDTGYSLEEFKTIVRRMYKEKADTGLFDFILLLKQQ